MSVGRSVTLVRHAKTAERIEIPFGLSTLVGPGNHVLDGCRDRPREGTFWEKGRPTVKHKILYDHLCKNG